MVTPSSVIFAICEIKISGVLIDYLWKTRKPVSNLELNYKKIIIIKKKKKKKVIEVQQL